MNPFLWLNTPFENERNAPDRLPELAFQSETSFFLEFIPRAPCLSLSSFLCHMWPFGGNKGHQQRSQSFFDTPFATSILIVVLLQTIYFFHLLRSADRHLSGVTREFYRMTVNNTPKRRGNVSTLDGTVDVRTAIITGAEVLVVT